MHDHLYVSPSEMDTRACNVLMDAHRNRDEPLAGYDAIRVLAAKRITIDRLSTPLAEIIQLAYSLAMLERDMHGLVEKEFAR